MLSRSPPCCKTNVVILLPHRKTRQLEIRGAFPPDDELTADDVAAATWCWERSKPAGRNADTLPGAKRLFLPMRTGSGTVGVIGLHRETETGLFTPEERRLLDSLNDQTALAIERAELVEKVDEAQVVAEADKLRVAMLTSLSHDLRTPLASILGAATTLLANIGLYDVERNQGDAAGRCGRRPSGSTGLSAIFWTCRGWKRARWAPSHRWWMFREAVSAATARMVRRISGHRVRDEIPDDLPFASADPLLLEQALVNLLDNAVKYSPAGSEILVAAQGHGRARSC